MSKPQLASEPSMEEILASIRKMISDDRPGPSPMPDQMGRTPFGEPARSSASELSGRGAPAGAGQGRPSGAPSNFNSLADALKVATALSDQRRSLQQEIASVLEKGPRAGHADPVAEATPSRSAPTPARPDNVHPLPEAAAPSRDTSGPRLPSFPDWRSEPVAPTSDDKQDLLSFDFGTVVPQRDGPGAKGAPTSGDAKAAGEKPEMKVEPQSGEDSRVISIPARTSSGVAGASSTASNASAAGSTVAPFPRTARDVSKPAGEVEPAGAEKPAEKTTATLEPASESPAAASSKMDAAAQAEALLDAVVDMVQQQPSALSVFTSGASFISGIPGNKHSELVAAAKAAETTPVDKAESTGATGAPPKLDRAAAELLRPMLRQWLADNMPRIVEEALRSELTEQTQGGKGPGNT